MHRKPLAQCLPLVSQVPLPGPSQGLMNKQIQVCALPGRGWMGQTQGSGKRTQGRVLGARLWAVGQVPGAEEDGESLMRERGISQPTPVPFPYSWGN